MRILVIGGSVFVGRHVVEAALTAGHEVSVFHRGHTPIPEDWQVEEILGDRDGGLSVLADKEWDAVVDSVGYVPRLVRDSALALKDRVSRYLFISTISVYSDPELSVVIPNPPIDTEVVDAQTYGPLKVECEEALKEVFGDMATIVRPGLIAGPYDPTRRFDYWVDRFQRYDQVLVPDVLNSPLELIDGRDLASFTVGLLEKGISGTFDAVGEPITFGEMIETLQQVGHGKPVMASPDWLATRDIQLKRHLPLAGYDDPTSVALMTMVPGPSLDLGLRRRTLLETAQDTAAWTSTLTEPRASERSGLPREREEELISELSYR